MKTPECPSKPLSLDEAIAHADEVAGDCGTACKREHKQLADWLRELKSRRAEHGDCAKLRKALITIRDLTEPCEGVTSAELQVNAEAVTALKATEKEGGDK